MASPQWRRCSLLLHEKDRIPLKFIVEFDIIPDKDYSYDGIIFTLYENLKSTERADDDLYPGIAGLHIYPGSNEWQTLGYKEDSDGLLLKRARILWFWKRSIM